MKITIITVCFNAQNEIEETINSVLEQTYSDIEYVLIDGASTDKTIEIIEKYRDKISCFVSEHDSGLYNAMNKAIKLASGDFLLFLNAGDVLYSKETLEQAVKYLKKSNSKLFFGDIMVKETNGHIWRQSFANTDKLTLSYRCLCHQAVFYKKELFEEFGGYDEKYEICADHDFNLKVLIQHRKKAKYMPVIVSVFKMGGFSTNRNNIKNTSEQINLVALKYYGDYKLRLFNIIFPIFRNVENRRLKLFLRKIFIYLFDFSL